MKRLLLLTDEEIDVVLAWAQIARGNVRSFVDDGVHEYDDEDDAVVEKLEASRLKA